MDREQLLQRKALLERKVQLLQAKARLTQPVQEQQVPVSDDSNPIFEGVKSLARGVEEGGLGVLQTAENIQKGLTGKPSKFQGVIDQSREHLPQSNLKGSVPGVVLEGAGQLPGLVTQVHGLGGGIPGLALHGALGKKDATTKESINSAGINVLLGNIFSKLSGLRAAPEAGGGSKIAALLARMGIGGTISGAATSAQGGTPEESMGQAFLGGSMSAQAKPYTQKEVQSRADKFAVKSRDEGVMLLPQVKGNLEQIRNTGENVSKYVGKSKNYEEVANQLEIAKGINAGERQKLYDSGVLSSSRIQHDPILRLISEAKSAPNANTPQGRQLIKNLIEIQSSDVESLNSQPKESLNDPNFYQKQKEFYQNLANEAGSYKTDPSQSVKARAYRAMAEGYQNKTYAVDEAVKHLNAEEKGLIEGTSSAREMAIGEAQNMKPDIKGEVLQSVSPSKSVSAARFIRKSFLDRFINPIKGTTSRMERYRTKADRAQEIADSMNPEEFNLDYESPKLLEAPQRRQIPFDIIGKIKRGELLPAGVSSGRKPIKAEGSSTIEMPEYTDTQMKAMAEKWGVPKGIREYGSAIEPPGGFSQIPKEFWKNMSPKQRRTMKEIIERRRRNFDR